MNATLTISLDSADELQDIAQRLSSVLRPLQADVDKLTKVLTSTPRTKRRRLNKSACRLARSLIRKKESDEAIAARLHVHPQAIWKIRTGRTYRDAK